MSKQTSIDKTSRRKFVYYKNLISGRTADMNLWEWERLQKDPYRSKDFEFIRLLDLEEPTKPVASKDVPIVEDTLECPLCGEVAKDEKQLQFHKESHGQKKQSIRSKD